MPKSCEPYNIIMHLNKTYAVYRSVIPSKNERTDEVNSYTNSLDARTGISASLNVPINDNASMTLLKLCCCCAQTTLINKKRHKS